MFPTDLTTSPLAALAALCAVVALILAASRGARLLGTATRAGQRMAVVETVSIDAKRRLHLVAVDGRTVMLLTAPEASTVVGWLPEPAR